LDVDGEVKQIFLDGSDVDICLVGNFGLEPVPVTPQLNQTGWWYNHFKGDSLLVGSEGAEITLNPGDFAFLTSTKLEGFESVTSSGSEVIAVDNDIYVFPNPFLDNLYVSTKNEHRLQRIVIYDISGSKIITRNNLNKESVINLSGLANGLYIIEIVDDAGGVYREKIVKQ
jgi:hypothetical protein